MKTTTSDPISEDNASSLSPRYGRPSIQGDIMENDKTGKWEKSDVNYQITNKSVKDLVNEHQDKHQLANTTSPKEGKK